MINLILNIKIEFWEKSQDNHKNIIQKKLCQDFYTEGLIIAVEDKKNVTANSRQKMFVQTALKAVKIGTKIIFLYCTVRSFFKTT